MQAPPVECVIGVDVGGTKLACAAVDRGGAILFRSDSPTPSDDGDATVAALLGLVTAAVDSCAAVGLSVRGVGVGVAGFVLQPDGVLLESPNIAWSMVPVAELVSAGTGLPAFVDNDANAAASGERLAGVCRDVDDFVCLTLGTGIGGGIYAGGSLCRGYRGTGGEPGHMVVDPDGPPCACGLRGCLEALASGTALEREAAGRAAADGGSTLHAACGGDLSAITGEMVAREAAAGDRAALGAFESLARHLGTGIVSLIHILGPRKVVLGGGVSRSGDLFIDRVRSVVAERGLPALVDGVAIEISSLGADAPLVGAAALAWEGIAAFR